VAPIVAADPTPESIQPPAPVVDPIPTPAPNAELLTKMENMQKELAKLQAFVAKARGDVPPAASAGEDMTLPADTDPLLFPMNYNDTEHREAVEKRGRGDN
jgi:hypothetical protein